MDAHEMVTPSGGGPSDEGSQRPRSAGKRGHRPLFACVLVLVALLCGGCGHAKDPSGARKPSASHTDRPGEPTGEHGSRWMSLPPETNVTDRVLVDGDVVVQVRNDGVAGIDRATGHRRWSTELDSAKSKNEVAFCRAADHVEDGLVAVLYSNEPNRFCNTVAVLEARSGDVRWKQTLHHETYGISGSIGISHGVVVSQGSDDAPIALDLHSGKTLWTGTAPSLPTAEVDSITVGRESVVVNYDNHDADFSNKPMDLVTYGLKDGAERGRFPVPAAATSTEQQPGRLHVVNADPLVIERTVRGETTPGGSDDDVSWNTGSWVRQGDGWTRLNIDDVRHAEGESARFAEFVGAAHDGPQPVQSHLVTGNKLIASFRSAANPDEGAETGDCVLAAFDLDTGKLLWQEPLQWMNGNRGNVVLLPDVRGDALRVLAPDDTSDTALRLYTFSLSTGGKPVRGHSFDFAKMPGRHDPGFHKDVPDTSDLLPISSKDVTGAVMTGGRLTVISEFQLAGFKLR